jgi:hypothetical protein
MIEQIINIEDIAPPISLGENLSSSLKIVEL